MTTVGDRKQEIVEAAFELMHEHGLEGLQIRGISERLGIQAPSIYWHVGSKSGLYSLMAGSIFQLSINSAPIGMGWRNWLEGYGRTLRRELLRYRDAARLCAIADPKDKFMESAAARISAPLVSEGLDQATALSYHSSVISFTLGSTIQQQSEVRRKFLGTMLDFEESFETGLTSMVRGFPSRL